MASNRNNCPVCGGRGEDLYVVLADAIRSSLERYYNEGVDQNVLIRDYQLLKCTNCSLEYSLPMEPGGVAFYDWITSKPQYYVHDRWEWMVVLDTINHNLSQQVSLLEVGCGQGFFLNRLKNNCCVNGLGLDLTPSSIEVCCSKGLEAYCETVEEYASKTAHGIRKFDYIVLFHTLEHLSDPKSLLRSLLPLLENNGSIFISTPFSPMSFETCWFDPLNHPPHHLTRWNTDSYTTLANKLGLDIEFYMPAALGIWRRVFITVNLLINGNTFLRGRQAADLAFKYPKLILKEFRRQLGRVKFENSAAADVILVKLKVKGSGK